MERWFSPSHCIKEGNCEFVRSFIGRLSAQYEINKYWTPQHPAFCPVPELHSSFNPWLGVHEIAILTGNRAAVFLNSNKPATESREAFFHELCHILLHIGNQLSMNRGFLDLQEEQANHFLLYATLPFYMIQQIQLPQHESDTLDILASEFCVSYDQAKKRWDQIKRRIYAGKQQFEYENELRSRYRKADPSNWSNETKTLYELAIHRKQLKGMLAK